MTIKGRLGNVNAGILTADEGNFASSTIFIGGNLSLSSGGQAIAFGDVGDKRGGFVTVYDFDESTGSNKPYYRVFEGLVAEVIQNLEDTSSGTAKFTANLIATSDYFMTEIVLKSVSNSTENTLRIYKQGKEIARAKNVNFVGGQDITVGINPVVTPQGNLNTGIFIKGGETYTIEVEGVDLKGTGTVGIDFEPFYKLKRAPYFRTDIADISDVEASKNDETSYFEISTGPETLPVTDKNIFILCENGSDITQTLPNLLNVYDGTKIYVDNASLPGGGSLILVPGAPGQSIGVDSELGIETGEEVQLIANKRQNGWEVYNKHGRSIESVLDKDDNPYNFYKKVKFNNATITTPAQEGDTLDINIKGSDGIDYVTLDAEGNPTAQTGQGHKLKGEVPIEFVQDPVETGAVRARVKPGYYELTQAPGYYATLNDEVEVTGLKESGVTTGILWFDDTIKPAGAYIDINRNEKAIGLQEDDEKDPNITGGTAYLIHYRVAFKGEATGDSFIEIYLRDKLTQEILTDWNGEPIGVKKIYKTGEKLGVLELTAIKKFTGIEEFQMVVEHQDTGDNLVVEDRTEGNSCIMIQALHSDSKTGLALLQMENDLLKNIEFVSHYMGDGLYSISYFLQEEKPVTTITAGTGETSADGWHFYNTTQLKVGIDQGKFTIEDDGINLCYFSFGKVISAEKTQLLRNKTINVSITCGTPNNGYDIYGAKWLGTPDEYTKAIITGENNSSPIVEANWELLPNPIFVAEDIINPENTVTGSFVVPEDAENFAIVLVPVEEQQPSKIIISEFKGDVADPFLGYFIHESEEVDEQHLEFSDKYKEFGLNTESYGGIRYTINSTDTPMPAGKAIKGSADITGNWSGLGGAVDFLTFNADGKAKISTTYNVYPGESIPVSGSTTVNFWWAYESAPSTWTKIPQSEGTFTIQKDQKGALSYTTPEFTYPVNPSTKLRAYASAGINDGAYIETTNPNVYLCQTIIDFNELIGKDDLGNIFNCLAGVNTNTVTVPTTAVTLTLSEVEDNNDISFDLPTGVATFAREDCYTITATCNLHVTGTNNFIELWVEKYNPDTLIWEVLPNVGYKRELAADSEGGLVFTRVAHLEAGTQLRLRALSSDDTKVELLAQTLGNGVNVPSIVYAIKN